MHALWKQYRGLIDEMSTRSAIRQEVEALHKINMEHADEVIAKHVSKAQTILDYLSHIARSAGEE